MRFCTKGCFLNLTGEKIPLNRILLLTQTMSQRHFIKMALEKMMGLSRMMVKIILVGQRSRAGLAKVGCPVSTDFISLNPSSPNINKQTLQTDQYIFVWLNCTLGRVNLKTTLPGQQLSPRHAGLCGVAVQSSRADMCWHNNYFSFAFLRFALLCDCWGSLLVTDCDICHPQQFLVP